jgi:hypothetical protein
MIVAVIRRQQKHFANAVRHIDNSSSEFASGCIVYGAG